MTTATLKELNVVAISNRKCGFCGTGTHDRCPGGTRSGRTGVRICPCEVGKRCGQPRCLKCSNRDVDSLDLNDWTCISTTECESRIQSRLLADPQYQAMQSAREKAMTATTEENKAKREKVVKEGTCLVTGAKTKGGLFAPGQDAKYVSLRVADVAEKGFTKAAEAEQLKKMQADGTSEKLQAKFVKAVGLAKDRAEKAKDAAKAKAQADKDKAAAKKAAPAKKAAASKADADDED